MVSGVERIEETVDASITNITLTVPSCGVSAVTISAINSVGRSDKSDPKVFSKNNEIYLL